MDKESIKYIRNIFTNQIISIEASHNGVSPEMVVNFSNNGKIHCDKFSINNSSYITSIYFGAQNTLYIDNCEITYCFTDDKYIYAIYVSESSNEHSLQSHIKIKLNE